MNNQMNLNRLTLEFSGESSQLEEPFLNYYFKTYFTQVRILVFLACLMYLAFGIMAVLLIPEQTFNIFFISFIIIGPFVLFFAFLLISFTGFFKKHMQSFVALCSILAGAGALSMIAISPDQLSSLSYFYYAGLMIVIMWNYTLLRLFFVSASLAGWVPVILYAVGVPLIMQPSMTVYINNNFFFIGTNLIGMMACYIMEHNTRRDFFITQQLEIERENINKINRELEDRVKKRTRELEGEIAERKQSGKSLKASEERYRLLADNVTDVIFTMDMNFNYTYASPSANRILGYTVDEAMTMKMDDTVSPETFNLLAGILLEELEIEKRNDKDLTRSRVVEYQLIHKNGSKVWVETTLTFLRDENNTAAGVLGIVREVNKRKQAEEKLHQTLDSLRKAVGTTIQVLVSALEVRDPYTAGHQSRSADLACAIATEMGLPQDKIEGIRMAGIIHDIGKLAVPAEILSKPTKLTKIEFSMIKEHPQSGYEMLKDVESPWPLAQIVHQHHERLNGTGYPRNLKGNEILLEARIMSVADVVEAMASHRPYRPALGIEVALEEIEKNKGILYDNAVADACLKLFREKGYRL